jgi:hypothetical protein
MVVARRVRGHVQYGLGDGVGRVGACLHDGVPQERKLPHARDSTITCR